jgi:hyaluronoglucosaminidase
MKPRSLILALATLLLPLSASAQYTIYPVPHSQTAGTGNKVTFTQNVNIVCDDAIDEYTLQRAQTILSEHGFTGTVSTAASSTLSNVYLGVADGNGLPNSAATKLGLDLSVLTKSGKFDRHVLSLTDANNGVAQLIVIGENTDATFMGLASLEQMLDAYTANMPTVTISDYADLKERGIIEGFYGKPYSCEVRKDLLRFMMRNKMNCYVYGPKSDVYHSGKWAEAYPTELTETQRTSGYVTQQDLKEFTSVARQTKVSVVWAIHPGDSLLEESNVVDRIVGKFAKMYDLGFRQFAVFADDVSIPSDQSGMKLTATRISDIQKAMESRWNVEGAAPADTIKPLRFTPQIYCRNYAASAWQFNTFFKALAEMPSNVTVYYTGAGVWSVPNNNDLNTVQNQFGRNVIWWWNYPCNDNGTGPSEIYPMDMYSNFVDMPNVTSSSRLNSELTASNQGILCNPMEQGSAARTALFSAGDYSWNNKSFNNSKSWEASFKALFPGRTALQTAYKFLAPYLSTNDPDDLNTAIENYKSNHDNDEITSLMEQIIDNCDVISTMEHSSEVSDSLLYVDIRPWVLHLRAMAVATKGFIASQKASNATEAWKLYLPSVKLANTLSLSDDFMTNHMSGFGADGISTSKRLTHTSWAYLSPFVTEYLGKNVLEGVFPSATKEDSVLTNVDGAQITLNSTSECLSLSGNVTLPANGFAGFVLAQPTRIKQLYVDDTLFADKDYNFMYSTDGKTWKTMTQSTVTTDDFVYYMVALNVSGASKALSLTDSSMKIYVYSNTPEKVKSVTLPAYNYWDSHTSKYLTDGDYTTYTCLNRDIVVGDTYTLELANEATVENVRICMGTTNEDYPQTATVSVSADKTNWTQLTVKGTHTQEYSMSLPQNVCVATEPTNKTNVMALDFVPTDADFNVTPVTAKYIRFQVTAIQNQARWMRIHEIEVNGRPAPTLSPVTDAEGNNLETATDADGMTSTGTYALGTSTSEKKFIYRFLNIANAKSLTLFCDESTLEGVTYKLTCDGTTWKAVTPVSDSGVLKFSFDANTKPQALQIEWTTDVIPAIYEAVEQVDAAAKPEITDVSAVTDNSNAAVSLTVENGALVARSAAEISSVQVCTTDGRCLASQSLGGATDAFVPVVTAAGQVFVVKVILANGKNATYKIATR